MTNEEKRRFEERCTTAKHIGHARWNEQRRIGDKIEQLLDGAETEEACQVLVALARHIFDGAKS